MFQFDERVFDFCTENILYKLSDLFSIDRYLHIGYTTYTLIISHYTVERLYD